MMSLRLEAFDTAFLLEESHSSARFLNAMRAPVRSKHPRSDNDRVRTSRPLEQVDDLRVYKWRVSSGGTSKLSLSPSKYVMGALTRVSMSTSSRQETRTATNARPSENWP